MFHRPHPVFSSILYVHVSEMLCACQRCCVRFPTVVHVSQKLCTCHRSCARFTSPLITFCSTVCKRNASQSAKALGRPNTFSRYIYIYVYIYMYTHIRIQLTKQLDVSETWIFNDTSIYMCIYICILVGGFNHLEKYEFVNGKDDIPYIKIIQNI